MRPQQVLGIRLREVLKERGLTQAQFAQMSGLSQATVSNLEGNRQIRYETLEIICRTLNLTPADLIEYDPS